MKRFLRSLLLGAVPALWMAAALAQYPTRPVKLVVPFPPGGPNDIVARVVGQQMTGELGQPLVVENRAGAGGTIGADSVARAAPDGYTLLLGTTGSLAIAPSLHPSLPYDPATSLTPISQLTRSVMLVVANASVPANSLRELIDLAKSRPAELTFAGVNGAPPHIAGEMFKQAAGVNLVHVPYKGMGPAIPDLIGGRTQLVFEQLAALHPHIKAGKLKALAVAAPSRIAQLPDVPTAAEAGLPGYEVAVWSGMLAPAGTPEDIAVRLNAAVHKALVSKEVRDAFSNQGLDPAPSSRREFSALIVADVAKWSRAVRLSGAKLD